MGKKTAVREYVSLECSACKERNYRTSKRVKGGTPKLSLKKFCNRCRAHTTHVERKK
ncbi:MAG: 50S ribosomal protein L33 [Planctomycetes bacterium]|nr:50S ribosomal protein L33 [Planctomycetota bacterium]